LQFKYNNNCYFVIIPIIAVVYGFTLGHKVHKLKSTNTYTMQHKYNSIISTKY